MNIKHPERHGGFRSCILPAENQPENRGKVQLDPYAVLKPLPHDFAAKRVAAAAQGMAVADERVRHDVAEEILLPADFAEQRDERILPLAVRKPVPLVHQEVRSASRAHVQPVKPAPERMRRPADCSAPDADGARQKSSAAMTAEKSRRAGRGGWNRMYFFATVRKCMCRQNGKRQFWNFSRKRGVLFMKRKLPPL